MPNEPPPPPPTPRPAGATLEADVVVVGARCAGAATAMLLARAGHDVLVLDRAAFPSDTISTHVIARSGMVQLHRWGVLESVVASGAPKVHQFSFTTSHGSLVRDVKDRYGVDFLLAPRRIVLDALLQAAAVESGARLLTGVAVTDVLHDADGRVVGVVGRDEQGPLEVRARHVVGADGLSSRIARAVAAPMTLVRPGTGATQFAYFAGDWSPIEQFVGEAAFAGVFPTHGGEACVWVCAPELRVRAFRRRHGSADATLLALLAEAAPTLVDRLDPANQRTPVRGMMRMPNHVRRAAGPGWALVGDAGLHRDAVTGHGISDAFRDAELLAVALDDSLTHRVEEWCALRAYERERDRMAEDVFRITCELSTYPEEERFSALQRDLAVAIDAMAAELDSRPLPREASAAA